MVASPEHPELMLEKNEKNATILHRECYRTLR